MKLGVFTVLLGQQKLSDALDYLARLGVQAVELGTGGYPGPAHAPAAELIKDAARLKEFKKTIADSGMEISALSCHGNPIHPQKEVAEKFHADYEDTLRLAEELQIDRVVTFSGCPGDSPTSQYPNWVVCPWPDDFLKILEYQWNDVLIPYWKKAATQANQHGVQRIAFEMHPGFCVYNTETMLKLREAVGETIGANFDPSHLFWQGIDPVESIRKLGKAIYHFHAKDCRVDGPNTRQNGVLDTKHYGDEANRSWIFRTVGYGHGYQVWKDMLSELRLAGYDDVISIEHEDSLMSVNEGLSKAVEFLKEVMLFEDTGGMWWA